MWVFRRPEQKWDREMIDPYEKSKQASVMVWGCFSGAKGRSELIVMERDEEAPRGGYSAQSYCNALDKGLVPYYEPGLTFMEDNARVHTARITRQWHEEHGIWVMEWPPYSPDLNPIEHLWAFLKQQIIKDYPETLEWSGSHAMLKERLAPLIVEAWQRIPQEYLDSCWQSMKKRCEAVIEAEGWYTKY